MKRKNSHSAIWISVLSMVLLTVFFSFLLIILNARLRKDAVEDSKKTALLTSKEISTEIEIYFRDALTLTKIYASNLIKYKNNNIPREVVYKMMQSSLAENKNFLALWTMWEPNTYDNKDRLFANDSIHDIKGNFAIAYYFDGNLIKQEINDTLDYYEDFYAIPKNKKQLLILDPFHYVYHGNPKVFYETSIICPIIENNTFLGVFGVDIDLESLQQKYKSIKIFETGFISVLSNSGQIVTNPDSMLIDSPLKKYLVEENQHVLDSMKRGIEFSVNTISEFTGKPAIRYFFPVNTEFMSDPWYIMIEIPEKEIFMETHELMFFSVLVIAIIFIVILILILNVYLTRRNEIRRMVSEDRYRALFENANDAIFIMKDDKFIECNPKTLHIFGCTREQIINHSPYEFSPPYQPDGKLSSEKAPELIREAFEGQSLRFEWLHCRYDRTVFEAEVSLNQLVLNNELFIQAIVRDISERKKAERALKESELRIKSISDNFTSGMIYQIIIDDKGNRNFSYISDSVSRLYGVTPEAAMADSGLIYNRIHKDDIEFLINAENKALESFTTFKAEARIIEPSGNIRWSSFVSTPKKLENGLIAWDGIEFNITDLKQAEMELEKHKNHLEELVKERTYEIEALVEELRQTNEELQSTNDLLTDQKNKLQETLKELKDAQNQLIQSEKMAALGVLTAGIAHEINNPINFINSAAQALESVLNDILKVENEYKLLTNENFLERIKIIEQIKRETDFDKSLEIIPQAFSNLSKGVERTVEIVKGLRLYSRMDQSEKKPVSLHEILDSALLLLKNRYKNHIAVIKEYSELPPVYCYPGKINQVFVNIIFNAVDAIFQKENLEQDETILIKTEKQDDKAIIKIIDTGKGVPEEIKDRIFDPFFTTKEAGKGSGLGLAISLSIIKEHHGNIFVQKTTNGGTEFIIELPVNETA